MTTLTRRIIQEMLRKRKYVITYFYEIKASKKRQEETCAALFVAQATHAERSLLRYKLDFLSGTRKLDR